MINLQLIKLEADTIFRRETAILSLHKLIKLKTIKEIACSHAEELSNQILIGICTLEGSGALPALLIDFTILHDGL